jgi:hypothetical protein
LILTMSSRAAALDRQIEHRPIAQATLSTDVALHRPRIARHCMKGRFIQ